MGAKSYYWIKLYYDMLDDHKVGNLPDSLKWRFIQCLLVAGEQQDGGFLPPLDEMSYRIRPITPEALNDDLSRMAKPGLVELKQHADGTERWFVTHFNERQQKVENADRQRAWRERQRAVTPAKRNDNEGVTIRYADIDIDIDKDKENIYINPDTEAIAEIKTAISQTSKTPLWAKTEDEYDQAAHLLESQGATPERVFGFLAWWKINGSYTGKPALKSLLGEWTNYVDGVIIASNGNKNGQHKILYQPDENGVY